jgi:integrase
MNRANALRRILRWLWEHHGSPKLDQHVRRYPGLRPRNVTARDDERAALLAAAPAHLRLFLLLCSDLAIRSGTACRLGPEHYDPRRGLLSFSTKYGAKLTLPATAEIEELLTRCSMQDPTPFVRQLWFQSPHAHNLKADAAPQTTLNRALRRLRLSLGITRKLTPHDFRRTTAVAMLEETGDVRDVQALLGHRSLQATIWYLDHDLRPVQRNTLELLKRPKPQTAERTA